jgi:WD40 repeat protein
MLLERPGEIVSREEIQKRLWSADTFVDFDHSLNTAINKIREALGDLADSPRFVETVPRRGYRFIAPVEGNGLAGAALSPSSAQEAPFGQGGRAGEATERPRRKRWPVGVGAVLGPLAPAVLAWYGGQRWSAKPELRQRQLTTNSSEILVWASAISPDGRYLAYSDDSGIHLKVIDTAETHPLPTPAGFTIYELAWFPDGNKLLASAEAERGHPPAGPPGVSSLWAISILGGTPQRLRDIASDGSVFQDGAGIVFVSGNGKEIWQMGPEGEEARKLTTTSEGVFAMPVVARGRLWYEKLHGVSMVRTRSSLAT